MVKAKLKFNLDDHEDRLNHLRCIKSSDMAEFIWELKHNFWRKWKYDDSGFNLETYKEALWELMDEYNINIDELTNY